MLQGLVPASATRAVVYLKPINMRWGVDKLRELCSETIGIVPDPSTMFLFTNKKRDSLLMYCADYDGEQTFVKKLEKGGFLLPESSREGEPFVIMKPSILPRLFR